MHAGGLGPLPSAFGCAREGIHNSPEAGPEPILVHGPKATKKWPKARAASVDARVRALAAALALLILAPAASAAASTGEFVATGSLRLPAGSTQELTARAAYLRAFDTEGFSQISLEAETVRVHRFYREWAEVRVGAVQPNFRIDGHDATYTLTNVTVTLVERDRLGWLGLYFPRQGGPLTLSSSGPAALVAGTPTQVGDGLTPGQDPEDPAPHVHGYDWESDDPLLTIETRGAILQQGEGMLKVKGPDLRFRSDQNETVEWTGSERDDAPAGQHREQWLFLEYVGATLLVETEEPFKVAAAESRASWTGTATFTPTEGELRAGRDVYLAEGRPARVTGTLEARILPEPADDQTRLRLDLHGDLVDTTLPHAQGRVNLPLGIQPPGWTWLLVGLGLGILLVGIAYAARRARARPNPDLATDDRLALARLAAGRESYLEALAHVRAARAQAPADPRLLKEEGAYLAALGRIDEALKAYMEAAARSPDGDAEFQAGVLMLQHGDLDRAEGLLATALRRSPILVLEVLYDPAGTFDTLRGRPHFERAVDEAHLAVDRD